MSATNKRLPPWIKAKIPNTVALEAINRRAYGKGLATVCKEARCPNAGECFSRGTATFLIMGTRCTRDCRFCAVAHGAPSEPSPEEPGLVAASVEAMGIEHAVVTSVTRDDLPDGGAQYFAETIRQIRMRCPGVSVEVLTPDFKGSVEALKVVLNARPDVFNHNLETVERLYPALRPAASYRGSLELLAECSRLEPDIITKSGIMVGVGETREEILTVMKDLVEAGCVLLTIGQYLQPSSEHWPVARFLHPDEFEELRELGLSSGFREVAAGPLVRSSYRAAAMLEAVRGFGSQP